ncbi:amphi-Trp domain-containing protein [Desulfatibacillum alkenivorans DSM 16219]|jgi:amphi-Trp domain-containing protein|uniref:Amphi-Trp domain-containing protein n=1 Tax=Desulfatibacillum alkenivorans DSM 16219 TaxID=1121393 RepID=A0A1M6YB74_9BACT|nr:amphi-Trp domain-containing protein [Desulfatibacillum alkenivorans]SHL15490.1 amphi-Trp domain-containing protein [Desulfatibacillum alkenivorans DSM 16219]
MSGNKVSQSQTMELEKVAAYLEDLAASFKEGKIVVAKGDEFVTLTPPEQVFVEVEAKAKKDKNKFSLELSWRALGPVDGGESLVISSEEPEIEEEPEGEEAEEEVQEAKEKSEAPGEEKVEE